MQCPQSNEAWKAVDTRSKGLEKLTMLFPLLWQPNQQMPAGHLKSQLMT